MDLCSNILYKLAELQHVLECSICNKKCNSPVRIKTCGHYFCTKCLQAAKTPSTCPKCGELYAPTELDFNNLAKECDHELLELQELLQNAQQVAKNRDNSSKINLVQEEDTSLGISSEANTILYMGKQYRVQFLKSQCKKNAKGETPLHLACRRNKLNEIRSLINSPVDINAKDYAGWAPLHEAIESKATEIVQYLLENNCLLDIPGPDYLTPLHKAVILNNADIVSILLKHGADVHGFDYRGLKPEDYCENSKSFNEMFKSPEEIYPKVFNVFLPGKVSLYCHSIDEAIKAKLEGCKHINVVNKVDTKKVLTHFVIKKSHKLSLKIMQAMLEGLQFLNQEDVDDYIKGQYFINIPQHTFFTNKELNDGVQKAMMSAILKLPKLFDGVNFHIEDHNKRVNVYNLELDKEHIIRLIKAGGGNVLHRPPTASTCEVVHPFFSILGSSTFQCCNFIIYEEKHAPDLMYNMMELKHRSSKWLIDCVINYRIEN
ncbi:hypothetical protein D910_00865 [Dendroctonus ponderosae]|uniref:RING-type domain-containing protein n=1 Tax=Dendroctonus ponderosae TaxID=77166 RepID=U4TWB7_DENPD|nr:hypothetical protein D910_02514 [Dendroctonus ponderosae]ERL96040.1 hypothetical protein D910_00865 [Dendroctonus ponderosae]KAH1015544.1 hypothetical protein HUJ05_013253 [Dendroctonus ponderosae]